jgi:hypothetical protein
MEPIPTIERTPMKLNIIQNTSARILAEICSDLSTVENNNRFLFCLKGGMAYEILRQDRFPLEDLDSTAGNDFDTILLINPELDPSFFEVTKILLRTRIYDLINGLLSSEELRFPVLLECLSKMIPLNTTVVSSTNPFTVKEVIDYRSGGMQMNIDLISIFLNTQYDSTRPYMMTKLIDISIPHRTYELLRFDYRLYTLPGRIIPITINEYDILIADFLSILFDQSLTKTVNIGSTANKRTRRTARINNLKTRVNKANRNAIINNITPYLKNSILNGFVANNVVTGYKKTIAKAAPLPEPAPVSASSSSASASASASEPVSALVLSMQEKIAAARAAAKAAEPKA